MSTEWNEVTADMPPMGLLVEVTNDYMEFPVLATRGYVKSDGSVSPNLALFSLAAEIEPNRLTSIPKGSMVVPNRWRYTK